MERAIRSAVAFAGPGSNADIWQSELPGTAVELVLELDGAWELEIDGRRQTRGAFASGLIAAPVRSRPGGPTRLVQLALDPLAAPRIMGIPAGELAGSESVDLDALLGRAGGQLLDQVDAAWQHAGPAAAAEAAQRLLHGGMAAPRSGASSVAPPPDVVRAAGLLRRGGGQRAVAAVAAELGCSRRHLARRFGEWIGLPPSEFNRLLRFERATALLRATPSGTLARLAADAGYADHAHMAREFGALAGARPSQIAARLSEIDDAPS